MEVNIVDIQDGDARTRSTAIETPSPVKFERQKSFEGSGKRKRRRAKTKRNVMKPFTKMSRSWQERRRSDRSKRDKRIRSLVLSTTHAPFNNNQFLMEIHKPEPENNFTPSARTRDSSFSVDSEENYFYSLPEDEEDFLTKEFSSVYEDAQSERLTNMSKTELIQEYLLLEAKYENLVKRNERKLKAIEDDKDTSDKETSVTDKDSSATDKDISGTSLDMNTSGEPSLVEFMMRVKEQEEQIAELKHANEKLRLENEHLRTKSLCSSSEDSESDSSTTSISSSTDSEGEDREVAEINAAMHTNGPLHNGMNGEHEDVPPLVNGVASDGHATNGDP